MFFVKCAPIRYAGAEDQAAAQQQAQEQREREDEHEHQDLNRASDAELAAAKMRMDVLFKQNLHKPGSSGYAHDVRKEFDPPEEECDWDEES